MMSTAIVMSIGAEQSGKQLAALDVGNSDRPTFAQTLDTREGVSPAILGKDFGKDSSVTALPEAPNGKIEPNTKNEGDAHNLAAGTNARMFGGQSTSTQLASKEINVGKTALLHPSIVAGTKVQKTTEEVGTQVAEPAGVTEENQPQSLAVAEVALVVSLRTEEKIPRKAQVEENQIQLPQTETPMSQREALTVGRTHGAASEKKVATKTEAGDATQTIETAKSSAVTLSAMADGMKSSQGVALQAVAQTNQITGHAAAASASPISIVTSAAPVAASNVALSVESGKSGAGLGTASLSGSLSSGVVAAPGDGSCSRNALHGSKTSTSDNEAAQAPLGDPTVTAKPDAKDERSQTAAPNAGSDGDSKTRTAGDASVTTVHTQPSGGEAAAGFATPVIAGLTKPTGSEGGSSPPAGSSTGLREQDGSGGAARFAEPMPRTLSASPMALEVGIPDGTHGWLKVRAEMADGGVVNASVSAGSPASQEMLHRVLPSLTAYLQSEKVTVNTVVVHPTATAGAEARGNSAGPESGDSGHPPQQRSDGGQQQNFMKEVAEDGTSYRGLQGDEDGMSPLASYGSGGSWLSVRA